MKKQMTKLEFYQSAKKHFSKKENKVGRVENCSYPRGLCFFLTHQDLSSRNMDYIEKRIDDAVTKSVEAATRKNKNFERDYNCAYFASDRARMNFINSEIERLTK